MNIGKVGESLTLGGRSVLAWQIPIFWLGLVRRDEYFPMLSDF